MSGLNPALRADSFDSTENSRPYNYNSSKELCQIPHRRVATGRMRKAFVLPQNK
jgi:hypothetical protein